MVRHRSITTGFDVKNEIINIWNWKKKNKFFIKIRFYYNSSPENQIQPTPWEYVKCKQTIFVIKDQNIFIELIRMG